MNIIFGTIDKTVLEKYTVLELDTIKLPTGDLVPHWCLVESVPLEEFDVLEYNKELHSKLLENYRRRNWDFCKNAIEQLMGKWGGEVDTFYMELVKRIGNFSQNPPDENWDGNWLIETPITR